MELAVQIIVPIVASAVPVLLGHWLKTKKTRRGNDESSK